MSDRVNLITGFSVIPKAVTRSPLSVTDRAVYVELYNHGTSPDNCFPSVARLASFIGCSESAVQRSLRTLADWGWIEKIVRWDGQSGESRQQSNCFNVYDRLNDRTPQERFGGKTCQQAWDEWLLLHYKTVAMEADDRLREAASNPQHPEGSVKELQRLRPFRVTRREARQRLSEIETQLGVEPTRWKDVDPESWEGVPETPSQNAPDTEPPGDSGASLGGCLTDTPRGFPETPLGVSGVTPHELDQLNYTNSITPSIPSPPVSDTQAPAPDGADVDDGGKRALFVVAPLPAPSASARRERFAAWWARLEKKHERKKCEQKWAKVDMDKLDRALTNYLASLDEHERRHGIRPYAMQPLRFLNGAWVDWADGLHFNPDWPTRPKSQTAAEKFDRMDDLAAVMNQAMEETGTVPSLLDAYMRGPSATPTAPPHEVIDVQEISA